MSMLPPGYQITSSRTRYGVTLLWTFALRVTEEYSLEPGYTVMTYIADPASQEWHPWITGDTIERYSEIVKRHGPIGRYAYARQGRPMTESDTALLVAARMLSHGR